MEKKQTAVNWLFDELQKAEKDYKNEVIDGLEYTARKYKIRDQAKAMEERQHADTWNNAINAVEKDKWQSFEQYTVRKDKNGKEIYEGDVLAKSPKSQIIWIVYWHNSGQKFTSKQKVWTVTNIDPNGNEICGWVDGAYSDHSIDALLTYDNMVIGNIYDNPELLSQDAQV
jgi:uncharacterized phage protein (TIGR01671 family)